METIQLTDTGKSSKIKLKPDYEAENKSWIGKSRKFIDSHTFHMIIVALVVIDCLCVAAELIIGNIEEHLGKEELVSVGIPTRNLTGEEGHGVEEGHDKHGIHMFLHISEMFMKYTSLFILGVFTIEVFVKLILVPKIILASAWEIVDSIIVVISFTMIIYLEYIHLHHAAGLIALLRLWRIIEIINGFVVVIETRHDFEIEQLENKIENLAREIKILEDRN